MSEQPDLDTEIIECWCGAKGTYAELFIDSCLDDGCGGMHVLHCECGGDGLCVCHHHGEVECYGCADCNHEVDDYGDDQEDFYD